MALQRQRSLVEEIMKATSFKTIVLKVNLAFLTFFFLAYIVVLLQPSSLYDEDSTALIRCSLHNCHINKAASVVRESRIVKEAIPSFLYGLESDTRIGLVNMDADQAEEWRDVGRVVEVSFERVPAWFEWKELFPEWIDEEEENEGPTCPEIQLPDVGGYDELDMVVVALPCRFPMEGWARDVWRLQVHLAAAKVAAEKGRRNGNGKVKVAAKSRCRPMMEIFRCDDVVRREGEWWLFEVDARTLEEKVALPVGSCKLAMPLWLEGAVNEKNNLSQYKTPATPAKREAYATVIHSSDNYVCGAIALAQSLRLSGTDRDLVLLHDASIPAPKLAALAAAGWILQLIKRIRNPHAEKGSYNEYNYSKFRLWQLTYYSKVIFIDSDIIVLRNFDLLFHFPQLSATGNDGVIFNSGVMVIEPSDCMFHTLMERRDEIISYNGGDQGFLNEVFVWWHRLPRRVNFLKNFWSNKTAEIALKNRLFASDPPKLYSIHFLGLKPWLCYRDYDCNWDIKGQRVYASDAAHRRWWIVHDQMNEKLKPFCGLSARRKIELEWDRKMAKKARFVDQHWKRKVTDRRQFQ